MNLSSRLTLAAIVAAFTLISPLVARDGSRSRAPERSRATPRPNTVILKLKPAYLNRRGSTNFGIPPLDAALQELGAAARTPLFPLAPFRAETMMKSSAGSGDPNFDRVYVIRYTASVDPIEAATRLAATGIVEYAEPYWTFPLDYATSDPQRAQQYALSIIKAAEAWDVTKGDSSVVIAIIDSGVEWNHADLAGNIWVNPGEFGIDGEGKDRRTNGIDDDGNLKVDDYHGWDFIGGPAIESLQQGVYSPDNNATPVPANVQGYQGYHGTWTSGCASAATDNGTGIAAVGFNSRILPVKCSDDSYATGQVIAGYDGIIYAADVGAKIINCSFGGEIDPGVVQALQQVADYAYSKGALVIGAAGNFGINNDETPHFPAGLKHVFSVGASTSLDSAANFTHYGTSVDIYAPGVNILTTHLGDGYVGNGVSGTSFSAPITAGIAALVRAMHPDWTPDQIAMQIRATGDRLKVPTPAYGPYFFKRANAFQAVSMNRDLASGALSNRPGLELVSYTVNGKSVDTINVIDEVMKVRLTLRNLLAPTRNLKITSMQGGALTTGGAVSVPTIGTLQTVTTDELDVQFDLSSGALYSEGSITLILQLTDGGYEEFAKVEIPIRLPGWHKQLDATQISQTTYQASSLDAVTNKIAWASTNNANVPYYTRTTSGKTWVSFGRITTGQDPVYCITGWNEKIAWAGTGPQSGSASIYKTTNGGTAWTPVSVSSITPFVNGIHFFSETEGIALGDPRNSSWGIAVTSDGGGSWGALDQKLTVANASEVGWNNAATAFGDNVWFGTNNSRIYRSTDRGRSWSFGATPSQNSFGIAFADENRGIATFSVNGNGGGTQTGGYMIAATSDGGATWREIPTPFPGTQPQSVTFVPGTTRAFIGTQNGVYETSDFGANWKQMAAPVINYSGLILSAQIDQAETVGAFGVNAISQFMNLIEIPEVSTGTDRENAPGGAFMSLEESIPNPATGTTRISYSLTSPADVALTLHDGLGRLVALLTDGPVDAGNHTVAFDASTLPSGTYYCTLTTGTDRITRRLIVRR